MQVYTEIIPPTAVTHAVRLPLLSPRAHNLVVAKTSLLQIFETRVVQSHVKSNGVGSVQSPASAHISAPALEVVQAQQQTKLVLICEYQLSGTVTSLAAIKALHTKSGGHALLVSFRDAKVSLVEWDTEIHALSTVSIHYYEGEDLQGSPWAPEFGQCASFLTVDPSSRCAALKFGQRHLAILPFRQAGDDLTMGDYDPDLDGALSQPSAQVKVNGASDSKQTPYASSFVLPLTALDPSLIHAVDLAFLYEYREPTLGVLSSSNCPSSLQIADRKDLLSYTVFTLDLEQRARTPLLSVSGLPYDLHKLVPLPLPVGGALLLGGNEIIHVDQAGKTNAIAVNEFAKQCSSFSMVDQSELAMKLEDCVIEQFNRATGDMLLILSSGDLATLTFRMDGRSVSGLSVQRVSADRGGHLLGAAASCAVSISHDSVFVGSEDADSVLLCCNQRHSHLTRKRSHAEMLGLDEALSDEDIEDDDDLYGNDAGSAAKSAQLVLQSSTAAEIVFTVQDRLLNLCATGEPAFGNAVGSKTQRLDLVLPVGRNSAASIAFISREIDMKTVKSLDIEQADNIWCIKVPRKLSNGHATPMVNGNTGYTAETEFEDFVVSTRTTGGDGDTSAVYEYKSNGLEQRTGTNFESDMVTIDVGVLFNGARIVQVSPGQIQCYDTDLSLTQIVPMIDEETDAELKIQYTSFFDPYLLVVRDNSSVVIFKAQKNGDVEEIDDCEVLNGIKWVSGCVHRSATIGSTHLAYLLSVEGGLHIFELTNLGRPVFVADNLRNLPSLMSSENTHRRSGGRENITEILACDLGDSTAKSTYLIVRTSNDELIIYEPFHYPLDSNKPITSNLRWSKLRATQTMANPDSSADRPKYPLRYLEDIGGYSALLLPGSSPSLVLKEATSLPRILRLTGETSSLLSGIHVSSHQSGLVSVNKNGMVNVSQLPLDTRYGETGWAVRRVKIGEEVEALCYHPESGLYVLGTNSDTDFTLPEDDWHHECATEGTSLRPQGDRSTVKILDPASSLIVHEYVLEQDETILCMKTLDLEISEKTHERKSLIAVGTCMVRGEDLPSAGSIYIFDVITVVPEPDRPETNKALKLIVREESKGAVTALSEIGTEGFLLAAHGQKCNVRGLKEDNSLLPVAFLDVQCYVSSLKNVRGTGLAVIADAMKGVWLTGFSGEPYGIKLFGKSSSSMEVVAAEVLPYDRQLSILVADADCNLQVFEFNPDHPKSLGGQHLLHKSTFHTGHFPTSMTLLPSTLSDPLSKNDDDTEMEEGETSEAWPQVLLTTQSGALALITPLDEQSYRRMGALQTHLSGFLHHACGLNPRAYRAVESEGFGGRGILDGQILKRWNDLGSQKKAEACTRVGAEAWEVREDLELISGGGLGYL